MLICLKLLHNSLSRNWGSCDGKSYFVYIQVTLRYSGFGIAALLTVGSICLEEVVKQVFFSASSPPSMKQNVCI